MPPMEWTPALAVGVAELDAQHQELFRRAERLIAGLRAGDRGEVGPLVAYLLDYVDEHFAAEERLMAELRYPGLDEQRRAHAAFREDLARLAVQFERKGATALVSLTLHNWLSDWLRAHLAGLDRQLGAWMAERRGR
jgi:hemerythrin